MLERISGMGPLHVFPTSLDVVPTRMIKVGLCIDRITRTNIIIEATHARTRHSANIVDGRCTDIPLFFQILLGNNLLQSSKTT